MNKLENNAQLYFFCNLGLLVGPKFQTIEKMSARLQKGMRNSFLAKGINAK